MSDRSDDIARFLSGTPWQDWTAQPIAADASARAYSRLVGPDQTVVLMDADPETETGTAAFVKIARHLTAQGLSAPRILAADLDLGLVVMTDLGRDRIADVLTDSAAEAGPYDAATDVLVALDALPVPTGLAAMTPQVAAEMVEITARFYARCDPTDLCAAVEASLTGLVPDRLALRDVHAENLIWRPERSGLDRVGLLDFQDAVIAPRGYDLASLLSDIRRDVSDPTRLRQTARFAAATGVTHSAMAHRLAALGAQRNLRILGVFARLIETGKPQYADHLPRVWSTLMRDLSHPGLADLRAVVVRDIPAVGS